MLGIDIGHGFIKLVALDRRRRRWRLSACIAQQCHGDPVQALLMALQLLSASTKRRLPRVGIALPVAEMVTKTVALPAGLGHDQIDLALRVELEQALMPGAGSICLDYCQAGAQVLAVACQQSLMDQALVPLAAAGIEPALAAADVLLIEGNLPSGCCQRGPGLFIDAGATGLRLYSIHAGVPVYSRSHVLPELNGAATDPAAYLLLLRLAIQQYRMSDMLSKPDVLIVYGGAAALPAVQTFLQQSFAMPVHCLDPFSAWQIGDADQICAQTGLHASAFTLACALAQQDASCR